MPGAVHKPEWHLLDSFFPQASAILPVPMRNPTSGKTVLQIYNLNRSEPPAYRSGGLPRSALNHSVFNISPGAFMPAILVNCSASGFDPATNPIQWRLCPASVWKWRERSAAKIAERTPAGVTPLAPVTHIFPY